MYFKSCSKCCYLYSTDELKSSPCNAESLKSENKINWVCVKYKKPKLIENINVKPEDCPLDIG